MSILQAVEKRRTWLKWLSERNSWGPEMPEHVRPLYLDILKHGMTIALDREFSRLVDLRRATTPDDLAFDSQWLSYTSAFCFLEEPFTVPRVDPLRTGSKELRELAKREMRLNAFGWHPVRKGDIILFPDGTHRPASTGTSQLVTFYDYSMDTSAVGFTPWTYFAVYHGQPLIERVVSFERMARAKAKDAVYVAATPDGTDEQKLNHPLHEIRWLFTALQLMSQKDQVGFVTGSVARRQPEMKYVPVSVRNGKLISE